MGFQGAPWLDRPERDIEEEPDKALDVLELVKGSTVADVGAGSGYMTVRMADARRARGQGLRGGHPAGDARSCSASA